MYIILVAELLTTHFGLVIVSCDCHVTEVLARASRRYTLWFLKQFQGIAVA